jgi:hypothetical protein
MHIFPLDHHFDSKAMNSESSSYHVAIEDVVYGAVYRPFGALDQTDTSRGHPQLQLVWRHRAYTVIPSVVLCCTSRLGGRNCAGRVGGHFGSSSRAGARAVLRAGCLDATFGSAWETSPETHGKLSA